MISRNHPGFPALLLLVSLLGGCAASGLRAGYRSQVQPQPLAGGPELAVPSFRVRSVGVRLTTSQRDRLTEALFASLGNSGLYRGVTDSLSPGSDTLQVDLAIQLKTSYWWVVAWPAIYPLVAYWPIQPYTAKSSVKLNARGSIGGTPFVHEDRSEQEHREYLYGFFRKRGVEEMLTRSYEDVFLNLRDHVAAQRAAAPAETADIHKIRNIAVLPLEAPGLDPSIQRVVTDQLVAEFISKGRYQVLEREQIDRILAEQGFQQSGACDNQGCLVKVGQLLGVDAMVSGSISRIGDLHVVSVRVTDVQDGRILFASQVQTEKGLGNLLGTELRSIADKF
ncbi:MAG: hypothetical protein H6686_10035 [Fibrobacteria bacterium]|nr:hypothetical protein [Fibrobacteria bacterium]